MMLRVFVCVFAAHAFAGFVRILFHGGQNAREQRPGAASGSEDGRGRGDAYGAGAGRARGGLGGRCGAGSAAGEGRRE
ncbi:DUF6126 family protein [Streptomyces sp. NPDC012438]|uniref:DUF6126 family protein n=1 Tax=Streptomyces sp. NPDC012438 TaxID=3364833 RepID=UPI0036E002C6